MSSEGRINIMILGETGVGKSALLLRYTEDRFIDGPTPVTLVADLVGIEQTIGNKKCRLHLWDTNGNAVARGQVRRYYRTANAVIFLYDVTDISTFLKLSSWLPEFRQHNKEAVVIIVGNKIDEVNKAVSLVEVKSFADNEDMELRFIPCFISAFDNKIDEVNKAVSLAEVKSFADNEGMEFFETSAKTGENVQQIFEHLVFKVLQKKEAFTTSTFPSDRSVSNLVEPDNNRIDVRQRSKRQEDKCSLG